MAVFFGTSVLWLCSWYFGTVVVVLVLCTVVVLLCSWYCGTVAMVSVLRYYGCVFSTLVLWLDFVFWYCGCGLVLWYGDWEMRAWLR